MTALLAFPIPMMMAARIGIGLRKLTKNPATAIAGATRIPQIRTRPMATPAAGQTGDTFELVKGTERPSLPTRK
jgi:hypothetical protein